MSGLGKIALFVAWIAFCGMVFIVVLIAAEKVEKRREENKNAPQKVGWWARKTPIEQKSINNAIVVSFLIVSVIGLLVAAMLGSGSGTSSSGRHLSESAKREAFYNIVKTQDQNPDSNAWNEGVKEAAAKSYGVPMSEINSLIREGATNRWLTPPPP